MRGKGLGTEKCTSPEQLQGCLTFWRLGHAGRRVVLDHTLNTQTLRKTDEQKNF